MFNKITQTELNRRGATSLPTKPTIAPEALKREFDAPAKEIVAPAFNNLIDALESEDAATDIGAIVPEGLPEGTPNNLQSVLESINMISQDNKELAHKHDNKDILDTITEDVVMDADYVHTDNNYTDADKSKIANMVSDENYVHTDNNYTDSDKSDVASNTNARHTHENKPTLDKFSEVDGKPQFDGQPIGGEVVVSETATLPSTIESANGNIKAISMLGNAHKSANVFDEILELGSLDGSGNNASSTTQTRSKNYIKVNPNTEYTFSREGSGQLWIIGYKADKTIIADGTAFPAYTRIVDGLGNTEATKTFHTTSTTEYLRFYNNASTDLTVKIQINLGNTALPYEPYGIIMPSGIVESVTKNIIPKWYADKDYDGNGNIESKASRCATDKMDVAENDNVTFSITNINSAKISLAYVKYKNNVMLTRVATGVLDVMPNQNGNATINVADADEIALFMYLGVTTETANPKYAQLEIGTVATDYVEHKSSSINAKTIIPSFDLASVGDVKNELIVNADGSGKLIERVGKVVFDGSSDENWSVSSYANTFNILVDTNSTNFICDRLKEVSGSASSLNDGECLISSSYRFTFKTSSASTKAELVNWLGTNHITVFYIKATPTITDLTPSEVAQFLSLQTYAPSCTVSADCECEIAYHVGEVGQSIADVDAKVDKAFVEIDELTSDVTELQKVESLELTPSANVTVASGDSYVNKVGRIVEGRVKFTTSANINSGATLFTLPQEARALGAYRGFALFNGTMTVFTSGMATVNGNLIQYWNNESPSKQLPSGTYYLSYSYIAQ